MALRNLFGYVFEVRSVSLGQDDFSQSGAVRRQDLLFHAADGRTRPCSVTSPVMATIDLTGSPRSRLTSAVVMVTPAEGRPWE